jgi:MFS family permease
MMMADWLQGPYVYALYSSYGFSKKEIGQLFIAGFGASMILGTFAGSMADKYGRKMFCLAFGIAYSLSCVTKHSPDYWVLMVGRLLGGVATSLLFSVFESWMIASHFKQGFNGDQLGDTFTKAYFGNSIVAIGAGVVGGYAEQTFGLVAPFDVSMMMLIVGTIVVWSTWSENYGDSQVDSATSFGTAWNHVVSNKKIWLVGISQSLFEGSMYVFVFMWTPQLDETNPTGEKLPYGTIFAIFMVSCMIGSSCVSMLSKWKPAREYMIFIFAAAIFAMVPAALGMGFFAQLFGFCMFEACVGVYFPTWGSLRSAVVPEESRSTIMNLYRVPLNFIVVLILWNIDVLKGSTVFSMCCVGLIASATCQFYLNDLLALEERNREGDQAMKELMDGSVDPLDLETGGQDI